MVRLKEDETVLQNGSMNPTRSVGILLREVPRTVQRTVRVEVHRMCSPHHQAHFVKYEASSLIVVDPLELSEETGHGEVPAGLGRRAHWENWRGEDSFVHNWHSETLWEEAFGTSDRVDEKNKRDCSPREAVGLTGEDLLHFQTNTSEKDSHHNERKKEVPTKEQERVCDHHGYDREPQKRKHHNMLHPKKKKE